MRFFRVMTLTLLAVIAFELGSISMKLPTPVVQAQPQLSQPIVANEHEQIMNRLGALGAKVDALASKTDAQFANLPAKMHDELGGLIHQVSNVKDMLRKHMGCQYPQCYQ